MAKEIYVGVNDKARKVKKAYVGINGVAHKVLKVYVGDGNNKARLCWVSECQHPSFNVNYFWADGCEYCKATATCTECGYQEFETDHYPEFRVYEEPTCTEDGKGDYHAYFSNELFEDNYSCPDWHTIEALDHDYVLIPGSEPTCTEEGNNVYTCSRCGDQYTTTLPALGHLMYDDWSYNNSGDGWSNTTAGYCVRTCHRECGYEERYIHDIDLSPWVTYHGDFAELHWNELPDADHYEVNGNVALSGDPVEVPGDYAVYAECECPKCGEQFSSEYWHVTVYQACTPTFKNYMGEVIGRVDTTANVLTVVNYTIYYFNQDDQQWSRITSGSFSSDDDSTVLCDLEGYEQCSIRVEYTSMSDAGLQLTSDCTLWYEL